MKVYTAEVQYAYEEDFGAFQYHWSVIGIYKTKLEAEQVAADRYAKDQAEDWNTNEWTLE